MSELTQKKCRPCEGDAEKLPLEKAHELLKNINGWSISNDGLKLRKQFSMKNFIAGVDLIRKIADLAEEEGHHPDLHLTGWRYLNVEISTHAVGGLTENDFILASKIDELPCELKEESA